MLYKAKKKSQSLMWGRESFGLLFSSHLLLHKEDVDMERGEYLKQVLDKLLAISKIYIINEILKTNLFFLKI